MSGEAFIRPGLELKIIVVDKVEKIVPAIEAAIKPYPAERTGQLDAEISAKF
jgi:hypothetical protein